MYEPLSIASLVVLVQADKPGNDIEAARRPVCSEMDFVIPSSWKRERSLIPNVCSMYLEMFQGSTIRQCLFVVKLSFLRSWGRR